MKKLTIFFFIFGFTIFCNVGLIGQVKKNADNKVKYGSRIEEFKNKGENLSPPTRLGSTILSAKTGQWDVSSTWVGGIIPNSDDDVVINPTHIVQIDDLKSCKDLTISGTGKVVISSDMRLYVYGDILNNGTIDGTADGCHLQFCGSTTSQVFENKGVVTAPLNNLSLNNPNGLSISSTTGQIKVLRVNLFWGTITCSNKLTIGNGGSTYGTVQRGAQGSTFPAGSFDISPVFNVGTGGLNLLYTISSTEIDMSYEVPSTSGNPPPGYVNYIYIDFVTNMTSDIVVTDSINLVATTFSIGANKLTVNNRINYYGGTLLGGANSDMVINGINPISIAVFDELENLTINNPGGVTLDTNLTVNYTLYLINGQFTNRSFLTMEAYSTIYRSSGYLSSAPTFKNSINLTYSGTSPITTGCEMPTSSSVLKELLINNSSSVIQAQTPGASSTALSLQSFEDATFPPTGWTNTIISGSTDWIKNSGDYNGGGGANSTTYNAYLFSNVKGTKTDLITPVFNCAGSSTATLTFYHKQNDWNGDQDSLALYVSSNGGTNWVRIYTYQSSVRKWSFRSWNLENYVTLTNNMKVKFHGCAEYGYGLCIDEVKITKTAPLTPSTVTVNNSFYINSGIYSIGNNTLTLNGSIDANSGTSISGGTSSFINIGGSISGSTLPPINYGLNRLTVNRSTGITLSGPLSTDRLVLTSGKVNTTSTNLLTVTGTTTSSISVSSGYVNGPLAITLPASLSSGYIYQLPVGKSASNKIELYYPTTKTSGPVVIKGEVFDGKTNGICGNQIATLDSNRYWVLSITSGASNFNNSQIRITNPGLTALKAICMSTNVLNGTYHYIGRWLSGNTLRSQSFINLSASNTYFTTGTADNNYGISSIWTGYYCFANSTMTGVSHPNYEWYDPAALGHTLINDNQWTGSGDDGYFRIPDIGFDFTYFGNQYKTNNVYIGTNGFLTFGSGSSQYYYSDMFSSTSLPANIIAACLRDLDVRNSLYSDAKVYYGGDNSTYFAVTYINAHAYGQVNDYITFQIVLFFNGNFRFQYNNGGYLHNGGTDIENLCVIGMQNSDRTKGIQYRHNGVGGPIFSPTTNLASSLALEFGTDINCLPVEMVSFNSAVTGRDVKLSWSTSKEINNSGFEVLRRKANEEIWSKVGFINGSGTTSSITNYAFTDNNLKSGKYNYRLKQVDYNGNSANFDLNGEVNVGIPTKFYLSQNYPNPFNATTKIRFDICKLSDVTIKIYDITGREIKTLINEKLNPDYYETSWNALNVSSGAYFIRIIAGDFSDTKKMILLK